MTKVGPFSTHHQHYDTWFDRNQSVYVAELLAVRALLPVEGIGLEIGVGTGRFAAPLGLGAGLDPAREALAYAVARGIPCVQGVGELLPFSNQSFDYVLMVTTVCFLDDPLATLSEARRVLKQDGSLIIGFINPASPLGRSYEEHKKKNVFYASATFYSPKEITGLLNKCGFTAQRWVQTVCKSPKKEASAIEPLRPGSDQGGFVVVRSIADTREDIS